MNGKWKKEWKEDSKQIFKVKVVGGRARYVALPCIGGKSDMCF